MQKQASISRQIIRNVLLFCLTLFFVTFLVYYYYTRHTIQQTSRQNAALLAGKTVSHIEKILFTAGQIPENIAWMLESSSLPKDSIYSFLRNLVANNPEIYGAAIAFEPDYFPSEGRFFSPYAYRKGDSVVSMQLGNDDYPYFYMDWYQIPVSLKKPYWTEPYFDEGGGNIIMSTYAVPFYQQVDGNKHIAGVVTVDLSLEWLTDVVEGIKILETGYAFLLSANGVVVSHPNHAYIMNQTIFTIANEHNNNALSDIGKQMIGGKSNFISVELPVGGHHLIYYTPLAMNNWSVGVVYPHNEMYGPLRAVTKRLVLIIALGLLLLTFFIIQIVKRITAPLKQFAQTAKVIASGNFETVLPEVKTNDEMLELHKSFAYMQQSLRSYISKVQETTQAREKIESELRIAREIQMDMLPHIFPPFPNLKEIDLFALLKPAKEVGGDLYDFFLGDNNHLYFAIGDVSGKGIPASLFMAVTRTLLRSVSDNTHEPAEILFRLNNALCLNNESNMFVTFYLGMLNLTSGKLTYANAGHNPPAYVPANGEVHLVQLEPGIPLGVFSDFVFNQKEMTLHVGDQLFLYTDGISEAENAEEVLYGDARLLQTLANYCQHSPRELVGLITADVSLHVNGYQQSDDLTMLSLAYHGAGN